MVDIVNQTIVIGPAVNFRVDPEKAERAGFGVADVADLEAAMLDGEVASNMIRGDRLIGIRVRYPAEYRYSIDKLQGAAADFADRQYRAALQHRARRDGGRPDGDPPREPAQSVGRHGAAGGARPRLGDGGDPGSGCPRRCSMPPGTEIEFGGLYQMQRESFLGLTQVLLMSILLIFIILVFEFRSFSHPIAILVATILCGFGALLALLVTGTTLNISSFMGAIMVVGIVHKNGILMLDSEQYFSAAGLCRCGTRSSTPAGAGCGRS